MSKLARDLEASIRYVQEQKRQLAQRTLPTDKQLEAVHRDLDVLMGRTRFVPNDPPLGEGIEKEVMK